VWSTNNSRPHGIARLLIFHGSPSVDVPQSPSRVIFPHLAIRFHGCQRCHVYNTGFSVFISYFLPSRVRVFCRIGSLNRFFFLVSASTESIKCMLDKIWLINWGVSELENCFGQCPSSWFLFLPKTGSVFCFGWKREEKEPYLVDLQ
jgi:hypothetical protein